MRLWIALLALVAAVGLALAIVGDDIVDAVGLGLVGVALVGAVSLAFFAVGRSEDLAREAEAQAREPREEPDSGPDERLTARRPRRSRGDS
jgi:F0F1-type ATP synthase assembly protein I